MEEKNSLVVVINDIDPATTPLLVVVNDVDPAKAPEPHPHSFTKIWLLGISSFFMTATFSVSGSILTIVKKNYFGGDSEASLMNAYFQSASSLIGMAILPVLGSMSDSIGRRPFLWLNGIGSMVPFTVLYFVPGNMYLLLSTSAIVFVLRASVFVLSHESRQAVGVDCRAILLTSSTRWPGR